MSKVAIPKLREHDIPHIKAQRIDALKAQRRELSRQIHELDPSAAKTNVKRDIAMTALKEMIKRGKEPKKVGWMNSAKSADHEINVVDVTRPNPKYAGWKIEEEDLDGDAVMDVIIKDQTGNIRGVNGYSVERTSFPKRKPYYDANPRPDQRRKIINGEENPNAKTMNQYINENNPKGITPIIIGKNEQGNGVYTYVYNDKSIKREPTPYKVFLHLILKPYWDNYAKEIAEGEGISKHLILLFYGILKRRMWNIIKRIAHSYLQTPSNIKGHELQVYESSTRFKAELKSLITTIERSDLQHNISEFQQTFNESLNELKQRNPFGHQQPQAEDKDEDEEFLQ